MLRRKPNIGISLIEMMVALVIFGIAMTAAIPLFSTWIQNTAIRTVAESIANAAQLARTQALQRNTNVQLAVANDSAWTISVVSTGEVLYSRAAAEGARSTGVTPVPNDATTVTFNGLGRLAANDDGSDSLTALIVDSEALPAADSRELCVLFGAAGATRMCDPALSAADPRGCPDPAPAGC